MVGGVDLSLGRRAASSGIDSESSPEKQRTRTALNHPTVLIVEDERLIAENLKFIMEERDWPVLGIAASGEEAIRGAFIEHPDLILMDVRIQGDMDGVQAAMLIQEESITTKPRFLFLSAHSKEQFPHLSALAQDSFAYLKKPYTPDELFAAIDQLLPEFRDS